MAQLMQEYQRENELPWGDLFAKSWQAQKNAFDFALKDMIAGPGGIFATPAKKVEQMFNVMYPEGAPLPVTYEGEGLPKSWEDLKERLQINPENIAMNMIPLLPPGVASAFLQNTKEYLKGD